MTIRMGCLLGIVLACSGTPNKPPLLKHSIESVRFNTTRCFGTCPEFGLLIQSDRKVLYTARKFNDPDGNFEGTITPETYAQLIALLDEIDFPNLKNKYEAGWTDDQTAVLTIQYDGNKTKTILDYGLQGTEGLCKIYKLLFDWRNGQNGSIVKIVFLINTN